MTSDFNRIKNDEFSKFKKIGLSNAALCQYRRGARKPNKYALELLELVELCEVLAPSVLAAWRSRKCSQ